MSHLLQRDLAFVVFWFFVCGLGVCVVFVLFSVFCFLFPFASWHALALSLTGAQRTDSSSASKKKSKVRKTEARIYPQGRSLLPWKSNEASDVEVLNAGCNPSP